MTILNAFLIHMSCSGKMTHKNFSEILVRELILHSQEENVTASGISRGRTSPPASMLSRLEVKHSQHWSSKGKLRRCCTCSLHKQTLSTRSELLREMAYVCELESVDDTKNSVDSDGARQIISLCSTDRKHLPCK